MKPAAFKPQRLDVAAFARAGGDLLGSVPLPQWPRLSDGTCPPDDAPPEHAQWRATGWQKKVLGASPEVRLRLQAGVAVWLPCQRCLQPLRLDLAVDRTFRFLPSEDEAAQLDEATDEEDVLAMNRALDLLELLEDEFIMALPIVPRHDLCLGPGGVAVSTQSEKALLETENEERPKADTQGAEPETVEREHPFAVLKTLKLKPRP